jgi:hypothetical protein
MLYELVELGEKGLPKEEVEARKFRAKLLGLIYEDLLDVWLKGQGYNVLCKGKRKGVYKGRRVAVDFILEKDGKRYVVEAKCWPAWSDRLKKLSLSNIQRVRKGFRTPFLEGGFHQGIQIRGEGHGWEDPRLVGL